MKKIEVTNPYTGELIVELPLKTIEQLDIVVNKAHHAKVLWADTPLYERGRILNRFADLISEHAEKIAKLSTNEMGKPISQSIVESHDAVNILRAAIERAKHLYGEVLPQNSEGMADDLVFTKREPLGVIACIIPNNFPIELTFQKIAPALIMGNTVIAKAPSSNPMAVLSLQELADQAGVPDGVLQLIICGRDELTEKFICNPEIDAVSMTGSTSAGIEIARNGASTLKRIFLELGGNDALIILEDADIELAVKEIISGRLENNGQVCCSSKRLIVHESIVQILAERLASEIQKIKSGDPRDPETFISCLVTEKAAREVENQIQITIAQGARLYWGGQRSGARMEPTILTDINEKMDIARDMEVFGPVIPIISFKTAEDAIRIANQSVYGLSAGIISNDLKKAMSLANRIQAGGVVLNGSGNYRQRDQAFGGYKMSGLGREGASVSLEELSQIKSYIIKNAFSPDFF